MNSACEKVLSKLRAHKSKGVTFSDFRTGFRLGGRVHDLRLAGYDIETIKEPMNGGGWRARYVLMRGQSCHT